MAYDFRNLSDNMLYMQFEQSAWNRRGEEERLALLQELECRVAREEGRRPMTITRIPADQERPGLCGYYRDGENRLFISGKYLRAQKLNLNDYTAAAAIDTVLHEGRHAFQHHVMRVHSSSIPRKTELSWVLNTFSYFSYDSNDPEIKAALYLYQPLELDARRFARQRMRRINNAIRSFTGSHDAAFTRHLEKDKAFERVYAALALRSLTPDLMDQLDAQARMRFLEANPGMQAELSGVSLFSEARRLMANVDRMIDDPDAFDDGDRLDSYAVQDAFSRYARQYVDGRGVQPSPDVPDIWGVRPFSRGRGF